MKIVVKSFKHQRFKLFVESLSGTNPAGERLSRSENFTVGQTEFEDEVSAIKSAERIQSHLNEFYSKKRR